MLDRRFAVYRELTERTLFRILNESPQPLGELCDDAPSELVQVIERTLAKDPAARFASALELAAALRPFAGAQRLLPSLDAVSGRALSDATLAEEDPAVIATPYTEPTHGGAATKPTSRRVLVSFAAGLALGAAGLFLAWRPREVPPAPVAPQASTTTPTVGLPAAETPPAAPSLPLPNTAAAPPTPVSSPVLRSKPHSLAPAASLSKPARPEPPRPNFDGRNPYLQ